MSPLVYFRKVTLIKSSPVLKVAVSLKLPPPARNIVGSCCWPSIHWQGKHLAGKFTVALDDQKCFLRLNLSCLFIFFAYFSVGVDIFLLLRVLCTWKILKRWKTVDDGVCFQNAGIVIKGLKWDGVRATKPVLLLLGSCLSSSKMIRYSDADDAHKEHEVRLDS